jgi:sulfur relay (sulfurtransferase) complex TusBCD TusD component (DsrE family)
MDARGLTKEHLNRRGSPLTMDELAAWTVEVDQVLTF